MLAIVTGGRRYSNVNALRHDGINPPLLGLSKLCGDDSMRRALKPLDRLRTNLPMGPLTEKPDLAIVIERDIAQEQCSHAEPSDAQN